MATAEGDEFTRRFLQIVRGMDSYYSNYFRIACRGMGIFFDFNDNKLERLQEMYSRIRHCFTDSKQCYSFICGVFKNAGYRNHGLGNYGDVDIRQKYQKVDLWLTTFEFMYKLTAGDFNIIKDYLCKVVFKVRPEDYADPVKLTELSFDEGFIDGDNSDLTEMYKLIKAYFSNSKGRLICFDNYRKRHGLTIQGSCNSDSSAVVERDGCTNSGLQTVTQVLPHQGQHTTVPTVSSVGTQVGLPGAANDSILKKTPKLKDLVAELRPTDGRLPSPDDLARDLEVSSAAREDIQKNIDRNQSSILTHLEEVLDRWLQEKGNHATWEVLLNALVKIKRMDLKEKVDNFLDLQSTKEKYC